MESIDIRWGEQVPLSIDLDDNTAVTATLLVGLVDEAPVITKTVSVENGEGIFELSSEDTSVAPGKYKYQINVIYYGETDPEKFPAPDCEDCDVDLPDFTIYKSLDEVS